MRTLALDPGIRGCGVALFGGEGLAARLVACDYVKNPVKKGDDFEAMLAMAKAVHDWVLVNHGNVPFDLVAEVPRIYTVSKSKGDNNDLLPLVGVGCAVATFATSATRVYPHEWKAQVPKDIMHGRIKRRLNQDELGVWDAAEQRGKSLFHNTADSVGIGLYSLGRLAPKKSWEVAP